MPTRIDPGFDTCKVKSDITEWARGRYAWTRKSDGKHVVEVLTPFGNKTRKLFNPEDVSLYDTTKVVMK